MAIFRWVLNLFFPPRCASCRKEGAFLCGSCLSSLRIKPISGRSIRTSSDSEFKFLDGVIHALDYAQNPSFKAAIRQFKYRFTQELNLYFASLMAQKLLELNMIQNRSLLLIPVPLHASRLAYRGFNQSELLCRSVLKVFPRSAVTEDLLIRTKKTSQQAKLTRSERERNLIYAFKIHHPLKLRKNQVVFLVDDVCTTGSTLEACAKVLKEAGVPRVYGLVVARAFRT